MSRVYGRSQVVEAEKGLCSVRIVMEDSSIEANVWETLFRPSFTLTCCTTLIYLASQSSDTVSEVTRGSVAVGSLLETIERYTLSTT